MKFKVKREITLEQVPELFHPLMENLHKFYTISKQAIYPNIVLNMINRLNRTLLAQLVNIDDAGGDGTDDAGSDATGDVGGDATGDVGGDAGGDAGGADNGDNSVNVEPVEDINTQTTSLTISDELD